MKIYSKIVGIILTIAGISALIGIIFGIIDVNDVEDKVMISLLFIPCLMFLHYMYIHNFGFNLKSEIPPKSYRVIMVFTILSLIVSIIVPAGYLLSQIRIENNAKLMVDREGCGGSNNEFSANLKTKYENGKMLYVLSILKSLESKSEFTPKNKIFNLELKDKDGFKIDEIEIKDITQLIINGKIFGISSNSSTWMNLEDYLKIDNWDLIYKSKN